MAAGGPLTQATQATVSHFLPARASVTLFWRAPPAALQHALPGRPDGWREQALLPWHCSVSCIPFSADCRRPRSRRFRSRGGSSPRLRGGHWSRSRRHLVEDAALLALGLQQGACRQQGGEWFWRQGRGPAGGPPGGMHSSGRHPSKNKTTLHHTFTPPWPVAVAVS